MTAPKRRGTSMSSIATGDPDPYGAPPGIGFYYGVVKQVRQHPIFGQALTCELVCILGPWTARRGDLLTAYVADAADTSNPIGAARVVKIRVNNQDVQQVIAEDQQVDLFLDQPITVKVGDEVTLSVRRTD